MVSVLQGVYVSSELHYHYNGSCCFFGQFFDRLPQADAPDSKTAAKPASFSVKKRKKKEICCEESKVNYLQV